jgi:hypothetical protein
MPEGRTGNEGHTDTSQKKGHHTTHKPINPTTGRAWGRTCALHSGGWRKILDQEGSGRRSDLDNSAGHDASMQILVLH